MEKRAVIEPGRTPDEHPTPPEQKSAQQKKASVTDLDNDFRKRAAEAAQTTTN